jgi:hypothetical protein
VSLMACVAAVRKRRQADLVAIWIRFVPAA